MLWHFNLKLSKYLNLLHGTLECAGPTHCKCHDTFSSFEFHCHRQFWLCGDYPVLFLLCLLDPGKLTDLSHIWYQFCTITQAWINIIIWIVIITHVPAAETGTDIIPATLIPASFHSSDLTRHAAEGPKVRTKVRRQLVLLSCHANYLGARTGAHALHMSPSE